jgi:hypothetical protein
MNHFITAAGHGSRFCRSGIKPPKPLIRVRGRELLLWSLSSFTIGSGDNLYIVTLCDHQVRSRLDKFIQILYPDTNVQWLELDTALDGQLLTTVEAIQRFSINGPLIVHNCDTYHDATKTNFQSLLLDSPCFCVIPCFDGEGDHWSFALPAKENPNYAEEVVEKVRISENCSVGTYGFSFAE